MQTVTYSTRPRKTALGQIKFGLFSGMFSGGEFVRKVARLQTRADLVHKLNSETNWR